MSYCTLNKSDVMEGVSDMLIHLSLSLSASIASLSLSRRRYLPSDIRSSANPPSRYLPTFLSTCPSVHQFIHLSIHPSIITLPTIDPSFVTFPPYLQTTNQPTNQQCTYLPSIVPQLPTIYYPSSSFPPSLPTYHQLANQPTSLPTYFQLTTKLVLK